MSNDLKDDIDYDAFRSEIEEFVSKNCPADIKEIMALNRKLSREPWSRWQKILFARGWGAPNWPVEYGGTGWNPRQQAIFGEVLAENDCPPQYHHGLRHIGPVLIEFGSESQKARYLPRILDGSEWWCQGYSEPNSGSDLASLKTHARIEGDVFIVNGQKTWTSHAQESDLMYTLVRTSVESRKQEGISLLIIPVRTKGITVRPIRTIDGWHHVNEVFLDNVEVPLADCIGEIGDGWKYGKFLLARERLNSANTAPLFQYLKRTRTLIKDRLSTPVHQHRRQNIEYRLLAVEAELRAIQELGLEAIDAVMNKQPIRLQPSVLKINSSGLFQTITEIGMEVMGPEYATSMPIDEHTQFDGNAQAALWLQNYFYSRVRTIYGGSNEVQKNMIAREIFGH
ncbi:acyl-CoA dehydrogenase family protein [Zwartia panacis]|uniref:acyl-CoA dehydrogenase family protein n=1 Tax=Zwartia panacis TaxID=2683345 RepID=UPI0025B41727|nr:acyl-CoA dehydrogenase family protein [Zwartia panacis]MDN4017930.1 acyl-CoA dehydrogenase family protein [Zwartia panacis]